MSGERDRNGPSVRWEHHLTYRALFKLPIGDVDGSNRPRGKTVTEQEKQRVLEQIREAQRRLEPRVADDVKRAVEELVDLYDSDLRKLAAS